MKMWRAVAILSKIIFAVVIVSSLTKDVSGEPEVPCYFAFGDSLSDPGNNNELPTMAKANYEPYGIDFPGNISTGRFTNGFTFVDILRIFLGFDQLIPPFNSILTLQEMLGGVNYASGSAGILIETGKAQGANIWLGQQIQYHAIIVSKISGMNDISASDHLEKCLYTLNIGSNDYIDNYFKPEYYDTSEKYTPEEFATLLVDQYAQHIKDLHELGARTFAIYGLGYLGCTLYEIAKFGADSSGCVDKVDNAALLFNSKLVPLIDQLNTNLTDSYFTYINSTSITDSSGFSVVSESCCPVKSDGLCQPQSSSPCSNRTEYYFWDDFHPTQRANVISVERAYRAKESTDVHPVDISHLIRQQ